MVKPLVAVDCDHVLADINEGMRRFVNRTYGASHTPDDYNVTGEYRRYWERVWDMPDDQESDRFLAFVEAGEMERLPEVNRAMRTIMALRDRYRFVVVTARKLDREISATHRWLQQYADGVFDQVIFMERWAQTNGEVSVSKGSICQSIGAEYLIDDNYDHCFQAIQSGVTPLLFGDYGWNRQRELPIGMERVRDWQAVKEYFCGR